MYLSYLSNNPTKIECGTRREMLGVYMHAYGSKTKNWGSIFFGVGSTKYLKLLRRGSLKGMSFLGME